MNKFWMKALVGATLVLCLASVAAAQSYRGRVQGAVTDQTQGAITGATVTLLNVATGVRSTRTTSEAGLFLFDLVDPGTYTVTVESPGFGKFAQENIVVQTARRCDGQRVAEAGSRNRERYRHRNPGGGVVQLQ